MMSVTERSENHGVLRRMLMARAQAAQGKDNHPPQLLQPVPQTPTRAAAIAVGRAAENLYRLSVQPSAVDVGALTLAEMPEVLPEPSLLVIVQGRADCVGVIALCPETVTALIEMQALGRVTTRPAERRKLTRSDAMLCVDFVDRLMEELAGAMEGLEGYEIFSGYHYATYLDDPRPLTFMLEDKAYRSLDFRLRLGAVDTREARIFLALPQGEGTAPKRQELKLAAAPEMHLQSSNPATIGASGSAMALADAMQEAPIELFGVLCRRNLTLKDLRDLQPGQMLPLPRVDLAAAQIETTDGQVLAKGKFGEAEGCHAIRLHPTAIAHAVNPPSTRLTPELLPEDALGPDEFREDSPPQAESDKLAPQTGSNVASIG